MPDRPEWFEDDSFWESTMPIMFPPERFEAAANRIDALRTLLHVEPPATILDLCCGPGRFSIPFAAQGFRVTAVDRTVPLLNELRRRIAGTNINLEIVQSDMRHFRRDSNFDVALNMFTSFGYFEDPQDDLTVLANVYASLKSGGRFLMEIASREYLIHSFQGRDWVEIGERILAEERKFIDSYTRLHNRWILISDGCRREWEFNLRLYGEAELCGLLREAGFSEVRTMSAFDGSPCDLKTSRLIALAVK